MGLQYGVPGQKEGGTVVCVWAGPGLCMLQGKGREFWAWQEGKWHIVQALISRLDGFSGYCIGLSCRRVKLTWDVGAVQDHQPGLG